MAGIALLLPGSSKEVIVVDHETAMFVARTGKCATKINFYGNPGFPKTYVVSRAKSKAKKVLIRFRTSCTYTEK
jgi:hypothetical protein